MLYLNTLIGINDTCCSIQSFYDDLKDITAVWLYDLIRYDTNFYMQHSSAAQCKILLNIRRWVRLTFPYKKSSHCLWKVSYEVGTFHE